MKLKCLFCIQFRIFHVTTSALEVLYRYMEFQPNTMFPHVQAYVSNVAAKPLEVNYWQLAYYLKPVELLEMGGKDREELIRTAPKHQLPKEWLEIMKTESVLVGDE